MSRRSSDTLLQSVIQTFEFTPLPRTLWWNSRHARWSTDTKTHRVSEVLLLFSRLSAQINFRWLIKRRLKIRLELGGYKQMQIKTQHPARGDGWKKGLWPSAPFDFYVGLQKGLTNVLKDAAAARQATARAGSGLLSCWCSVQVNIYRIYVPSATQNSNLL